MSTEGNSLFPSLPDEDRESVVDIQEGTFDRYVELQSYGTGRAAGAPL